MIHPLVNTLMQHDNVVALAHEGFDDFLGEAGDRLALVFLMAEPEKKPETIDVAVVLMELLKSFPGKLYIGICDPEQSRAVMPLAKAIALPSLVLFGHTARIDMIPKIEDWSVYTDKITSALRSMGADAQSDAKVSEPA